MQGALQRWTGPPASSLADLQTTFQPRTEHKNSLVYFKVKSNWCGTAASQGSELCPRGFPLMP